MKLSVIVKKPAELVISLLDTMKSQIRFHRNENGIPGQILLDSFGWTLNSLTKLVKKITLQLTNILESDYLENGTTKLVSFYKNTLEIISKYTTPFIDYAKIHLNKLNNKAQNIATKDTVFSVIKVSKKEFDYITQHPISFCLGNLLLCYQLGKLKTSCTSLLNEVWELNNSNFGEKAPPIIEKALLAGTLLGCTSLNIAVLITPACQFNKKLVFSCTFAASIFAGNFVNNKSPSI